MGERVDEKDGAAPHPDAAEHVGRVVPSEHQHSPADARDDQCSSQGAQWAQKAWRDKKHCGSERRDRGDRPRWIGETAHTNLSPNHGFRDVLHHLDGNDRSCGTGQCSHPIAKDREGEDHGDAHQQHWQ